MEQELDNQVTLALTTLDRLETVPGRQRSLRIQILNENKNNQILQEIFSLSYDWRFTFGTYPPGHSATPISIRTPCENWVEFKKIALALKTRAVTGLLAHQRLRNFFKYCSRHEIKWYSRILEQDLRIGASNKILGQIFPSLDLDFGLMPAKTIEPSADIKWPIAIEPRMRDGIRVAFIISQGCVTAYSEGFRPYSILECIGKQFLKFCNSGNFDGEITVSGWDAASAERLLNSKLKSLTKDDFKSIYYGLRYHVRDYFSDRAFQPSEYCTDPTPLHLRRTALEEICNKIKEHNSKTSIRLVPHWVVQNPSELEQAALELLHDENYSGIYLRDLDSPYIGKPQLGKEAIHDDNNNEQNYLVPIQSVAICN